MTLISSVSTHFRHEEKIPGRSKANCFCRGQIRSSQFHPAGLAQRVTAVIVNERVEVCCLRPELSLARGVARVRWFLVGTFLLYRQADACRSPMLSLMPA